MNESQTNLPSATEAALASPSVGTYKTATSGPDTQFSPPASSDAVEVNRLIEVRGERSKLSPEKVGHRLRKLGLPTQRLSQTGNGLVMDEETTTRLQMLSAMYVGEDQHFATENFHIPQATENRKVEEVM